MPYCQGCSEWREQADQLQLVGHMALCQECRDSDPNQWATCTFCGYAYPDFLVIQGEERTACQHCRSHLGLPTEWRWDNPSQYFSTSLVSSGNLPRITYGVELECYAPENVPIDRIWGVWEATSFQAVYDGSLSGNGVEFVSPILRGEEGLLEIKKLLSQLHGFRIRQECGFHLHLNAERCSWEILRDFTMLYIRLIPWLKTIVSSSRRQASFGRCQGGGGWYSQSDLSLLYDMAYEHEFWAWVYEIESESEEYIMDYVDSAAGQKYHDARYSQLNLHSVVYRNTIEIRCHNGTLNYEKVKNWVWLWTWFLQYVMEGDIDRHFLIDLEDQDQALGFRLLDRFRPPRWKELIRFYQKRQRDFGFDVSYQIQELEQRTLFDTSLANS